MESAKEIFNLVPEPAEEWQRMLRFVGLSGEERDAMYRTVEALLRRAPELVVQTYDYLRSVPETAAILGWEVSLDEAHLEERRRFFAVWLSRTLGLDTSEQFASYLFRAGKYHAGHGPRHIHVPPAYVTASIGLVLSAFARFISEAELASQVLAPAMAGWSKYLSVQLNQMQLGYQVAQEFSRGELAFQVSVYGRLRPLIGEQKFTVRGDPGNCVGDLLRKVFNYYPQIRSEALERVWHSEDHPESLWMEVVPSYIPLRGWRILLNGRDLDYEGGFVSPVQQKDEIAIFPPGR